MSGIDEYQNDFYGEAPENPASKSLYYLIQSMTKPVGYGLKSVDLAQLTHNMTAGQAH